MKSFLVIDGNSIMNRAFYGLLNTKMYSNTAAIHTNAIYAFLNIYWMIQEKINPDYVAVSFDLKAPTFRHKMYAEYKGTRKSMPDELAEQMPVIKEVLNAMNIEILQLEGYEADDILGTVANNNTKNNIFTYILTGDKDSFQLISDTTSVIIPTTKKGKTEYTTYTKELLKEKLNILPYQVVHIKALMGDNSDNIPGVKGIGEKTAYSLIWDNETLDSIYENIDTIKITPKVKEKLLQDKDMAYLSKTLATIDINVPITIDYEKCLCGDVDKPKLYRLFKKLEFSKFLNKYDFSNVSIEDGNKNINESKNALLISSIKKIIVIDNNNFEEYKSIIFDVLNEKRISYILNVVNHDNFIEHAGLYDKFLLAIYSNKNDIIYVINLKSIKNNSDENYKLLLCNFANSTAYKMGYNIKQDILFLFNNICDNVTNFKFDIMIAYHLMDSLKSNYPIEYILNDLYGITLDIKNNDKKEDRQLSLFTDIDDEKEFINEQEKKNIMYLLKGIFFAYDNVLDKLNKNNMLELFNNIEMPLTETLASMEHTGMYIDVLKLNEFNDDITKRLKELEDDIYKLAGCEFNINSTQQLGTILFEKLGLPVIKKKKTGYSTDKEVLEELLDKHEIINKLLEYRQTAKLKSTYVDGLKSKIATDGRIHTTFMQTVTSTGRLSSVEPNLQNIPVRLELGKKIRKFFVAQDNRCIIDADYSQIELRVLAHISNDETMINAFKNGIDIHKVTASQVFSIPIDDVSDELRTKAKAVNFGIVYGISEYGLAKNISISRKEASMYIDNYLNKYHGIKEFMENIVKEASIKGYVSTMFSRRRYIPELNNKSKNIVQFGKRVAMNTPIQGSAADIIKLAMNKIYYKLKENNLKSKLIMQVHDELLIECVPEEVEQVKSIMYDAMEHIVDLKVPLNIDLNVGKSWYDAK